MVLQGTSLEPFRSSCSDKQAVSLPILGSTYTSADLAQSKDQRKEHRTNANHTMIYLRGFAKIIIFAMIYSSKIKGRR